MCAAPSSLVEVVEGGALMNRVSIIAPPFVNGSYASSKSEKADIYISINEVKIKCFFGYTLLNWKNEWNKNQTNIGQKNQIIS